MSSRQFTKARASGGYGAIEDSDRRMHQYSTGTGVGGAGPSFDSSRIYRAESDGDLDGNLSTDDGMSDNEIRTSGTDEFGGRQNYYQQKGTGRQRKKVASRGKGSEFQAKRKKRRAYACCLGSEIDTIGLVEYFKNAPPDSTIARANWSTEMYTDTLRIYRNPILVRSPSKAVGVSSPGDDQADEPVFYSYATGESKGLGKINDSHREAVLKDLSIKFHDPYCKEIFVYGESCYILFAYRVSRY